MFKVCSIHTQAGAAPICANHICRGCHRHAWICPSLDQVLARVTAIFEPGVRFFFRRVRFFLTRLVFLNRVWSCFFLPVFQPVKKKPDWVSFFFTCFVFFKVGSGSVFLIFLLGQVFCQVRFFFQPGSFFFAARSSFFLKQVEVSFELGSQPAEIVWRSWCWSGGAFVIHQNPTHSHSLSHSHTLTLLF